MQLTRAQAEAWSRRGVNCERDRARASSRRRSPRRRDRSRCKWQANAARTFIGRNGELPDLAGTAIYLASRASDYVTGQTIFVDGGFSAG